MRNFEKLLQLVREGLAAYNMTEITPLFYKEHEDFLKAADCEITPEGSKWKVHVGNFNNKETYVVSDDEVEIASHAICAIIYDCAFKELINRLQEVEIDAQ